MSFQWCKELCRGSEGGSLSACHASFHYSLLVGHLCVSLYYVPLHLLTFRILWYELDFILTCIYASLRDIPGGIMLFCVIALFDVCWANSDSLLGELWISCLVLFHGYLSGFCKEEYRYAGLWSNMFNRKYFRLPKIQNIKRTLISLIYVFNINIGLHIYVHKVLIYL